MSQPRHAVDPAVAPPSGRDSAGQVRWTSALIAGVPVLQTIIDAMPGGVVILNDHRQVVAANRPFMEMVGGAIDGVLGQRLGEILGCPFRRSGPDGCGSSSQCSGCGTLLAIHRAQTLDVSSAGECQFMLDHPVKGASRQFLLRAATATIEGKKFTVCVLEDVSARRRLAELSAVFFHDMLNLVAGIQGHLDLLSGRMPPGDLRGDLRRLRLLADQLTEEIEIQRDWMAAEAGDLKVQPMAARTGVLIEDLRHVYSAHPAGAGRVIETAGAWDGMIVTDVRLLGRVLGNMLRNALEATEPGGAVRLSCSSQGDTVAFSVRNGAVMPRGLQEQVFKRSFSTKGQGRRGTGLRSMKLLGENYLGGVLSFASGPPEGTVFTLTVPKVLALGAGLGPDLPLTDPPEG